MRSLRLLSRGLASRPRIAFAVALSLAFASQAQAIPFAAPFTGPDGFGISSDDALVANQNFGIPIITTQFLDDPDPYLTVISQSFQKGSVDPFPPGSGPTTGTSNWELQNQSSIDLIGDTFLVFVTSTDYTVGGEPVDYDVDRVGVVMEADDGWVLIRAFDGSRGVDLFYPAVFVSNSLLAGAETGTVPVTYYINQELVVVNSTFQIPQLQLAVGFTPVPEPETAALLAAGLVAVGIWRRLA